MKQGHFIKDCPDLKPYEPKEEVGQQNEVAFQPFPKSNTVKTNKGPRNNDNRNRNSYSPLLDDVFDPLSSNPHMDFEKNKFDAKPSSFCKEQVFQQQEKEEWKSIAGLVDTRSIEDVASSSTGANVVRNTTTVAAAGVRAILSTAKQTCSNHKDSQAHAEIALSIKHNITPHIYSAKTAQQAWDILAGLYASQNEAKISYLHEELESKIMQEDDDMNVFLVEIKDLQEHLIFAREVIPDHSLVQIVLDALPESYQTFASTWRLVAKDIVDAGCTIEKKCKRYHFF
ncbi:hypothetical protein L7F22_001728 [Adiantum nelumboides]|nr:hypothetical protein [Adiantum nelumboides]